MFQKQDNHQQPLCSELTQYFVSWFSIFPSGMKLDQLQQGCKLQQLPMFNEQDSQQQPLCSELKDCPAV